MSDQNPRADWDALDAMRLASKMALIVYATQRGDTDRVAELQSELAIAGLHVTVGTITD